MLGQWVCVEAVGENAGQDETEGEIVGETFHAWAWLHQDKGEGGGGDEDEDGDGDEGWCWCWIATDADDGEWIPAWRWQYAGRVEQLHKQQRQQHESTNDELKKREDLADEKSKPLSFRTISHGVANTAGISVDSVGFGVGVGVGVGAATPHPIGHMPPSPDADHLQSASRHKSNGLRTPDSRESSPRCEDFAL